MNSAARPKISDLMKKIRSCLDSGHYLDTRHALGRQSERRISRPEVNYVLRHGWHEKKKDQFTERFGGWNYAARGKTPDKRELRVIVSFDKNNMLIHYCPV
mgnify:CR=1 FL=1